MLTDSVFCSSIFTSGIIIELLTFCAKENGYLRHEKFDAKSVTFFSFLPRSRSVIEKIAHQRTEVTRLARR